MCRLLTARFRQPTQPQTLLTEFANMSERSKSYDGDWQGDGWGVAWLNANNTWQTHHSLSPIWEDQSFFETLPETLSLVAHARSASFPHHKGVLAFNQPYVFGPYAFAFNGMVKGVSLPPIPGRIGAEKIWHLLKQELETHPPKIALTRLHTLLQAHSQEITALNIGLASPDEIHSFNEFARYPEYYTLHPWENTSGQGICSEKLF
jgi:predicted glutamine amidotransferase